MTDKLTADPQRPRVIQGQRMDSDPNEFMNIMSDMLDKDPETSREGFKKFDALSAKVAPRGHLCLVK